MSNTRSILAFSALLALASGQARASLASPAGPSPSRDHLAADRSDGVSQSKNTPAAKASPEAVPAPRAEAPGLPVKPAKRPDRTPEPPEESDEEPAKEEKSDCDDCVIVDRGGADSPEGGLLAGAGNLLAGTLWGLFAVSRPRRIPRAIIRGITVP